MQLCSAFVDGTIDTKQVSLQEGICILHDLKQLHMQWVSCSAYYAILCSTITAFYLSE